MAGLCHDAVVSSSTLTRWRDERCSAFDSLEAVHGKVTGKRRGRQRATQHLNRALFVALAAEFQGFCRDLQEDAAIHIVSSIDFDTTNAAVAGVVLDALVRERTGSRGNTTKERKLDKGNAGVSAIAADFSVLGLDIWHELDQINATKAKRWKRTIDDLMNARNGIAHSDATKITNAHAQNPLTLQTFKKWRSSLNTAATAMDKVVATHLTGLTGDQAW